MCKKLGIWDAFNELWANQVSGSNSQGRRRAAGIKTLNLAKRGLGRRTPGTSYHPFVVGKRSRRSMATVVRAIMNSPCLRLLRVHVWLPEMSIIVDPRQIDFGTKLKGQ